MKALRDHHVRRGAALGTLSILLTLVAHALASESSRGVEETRDVTPMQAATCGAPGAPACPLQAWMRTNLGTPLASNNMAALASGLDRSAKLTPDPTWRSWATFAARGAEAARKGDVSGARAACKGCHDAWREPYKAKHRTRPVPR